MKYLLSEVYLVGHIVQLLFSALFVLLCIDKLTSSNIEITVYTLLPVMSTFMGHHMLLLINT